MTSMSHPGRAQHESYDISSDEENDLFGDNFVTQPTQPLTSAPFGRRASPPPLVQVQASSPITQVQASSPIGQSTSFTPPRPTHNGPRAQPIVRGQLNGGLYANSFAPPGTQFQPVGWHSSQSQPQSQPRARSHTVELSEDEGVLVADSSEDEVSRSRTADIRPSNLKMNGQPLTKPLSQGGHLRKTSVDKIAEASAQLQRAMKSGTGTSSQWQNSRAQPPPSLFNRFLFEAQGGAPAVPQKRSADIMADAYAGSRADRPNKLLRQMNPVQPPPPQNDLKIGDIDYDCQEAVSHIMEITGGTVRQAFDAYLKHKHSIVDAAAALTEEKERVPVKIDLTSDGPEMQPESGPPARTFKRPGSKPTVKRDTVNTKSIAEKWSNANTQARAVDDPKPAPSAIMMASSPLPMPETPPKPIRRRLVQRRRDPSSPVQILSPVQASVPVETISSNATARRKIIDSDDEGIELPDDDGDDSGVEIASEDDLELEEKLLKFLNTCSAIDLIDVSSQPLDICELVLSHRPFKNLNAVRAVTQEYITTTKTGRTSTKKKDVGERVVEVCLEMYKGYEAVDELIIKCEQLGKPIAEELRNWGMNAFGASAQGELTMVDIPQESSSHDSGIGTPTSSVGDADELKSKKKLLQQPAIMSKSLVMKDYQVVGLNWLSLLFSKKLSCILADDMGLGKTCQVIAFLSHLYEIGVKGPHLVVVPGSTLENWLREFKNFSPNLAVEPYYGTQGERAQQRARLEDTIGDVNVIVTTYTMAMQKEDSHFLRHLNFTVCVYDEGHMLKNSESKRYTQLMRIPAHFRLLLTGTPLQNNLQELISLLAFIMPQIFRERYEDLQYIFRNKAKTDDAAGLLSAQRISRARSMMTPFILRRKKHQVLKHLPAKTCRVEYCEMTDSQRVIYDGELAKVKAALREREAAKQQPTTKAAKKGSNGKATNAPVKAKANVLMDLRKAAIHPLLFRRYYTDTILWEMADLFCSAHEGKVAAIVHEDMTVMTDIELNRFCNEHPSLFSDYTLTSLATSGTITAPPLAVPAAETDADSETSPMTPFLLSSGKITTLLTLLRRFISNGDRTLIFSQFTMVLNVLELVLDDASIPYSRLDGTTPMSTRQDLLDQFHADTSIPVFMLSTKAGGAGINLACANKVVVFDASFNPQEDVQAENRAHRVGQTREVEVVRLISAGTVEEQMRRLGEMKLALDERVAGEGGAVAAVGVEKAGKEVGVDEASDAAVEKQGMDLVESMLLEGLHDEKEDVKLEAGIKVEAATEKVEEDCAVSTSVASPTLPTRGRKQRTQDVKNEYLDGLKKAGLDMSAA